MKPYAFVRDFYKIFADQWWFHLYSRFMLDDELLFKLFLPTAWFLVTFIWELKLINPS